MHLVILEIQENYKGMQGCCTILKEKCILHCFHDILLASMTISKSVLAKQTNIHVNVHDQFTMHKLFTNITTKELNTGESLHIILYNNY
jgi:hypothetical protein